MTDETLIEDQAELIRFLRDAAESGRKVELLVGGSSQPFLGLVDEPAGGFVDLTPLTGGEPWALRLYAITGFRPVYDKK